MANPDLAPLAPLVGRWRSRGRTVPGAFGPEIAISGTDVYEWLGDGFLVHHVDVRMGDERVRAIELIGEHEPETGSYAMRAFHDDGSAGTMRATVDDAGVWRFADATTRATLTIAADGTSMAARWERSADGHRWDHWMDMTFTRLTDPANAG